MNNLFYKIDECIKEEQNATCCNEVLVDTLEQCKVEIQRLLDGNFTDEEFQNLCHNMTMCDRDKFEQGCKQYQDKLFGKEDIPQNVYWNPDSQNFYDIKMKFGMGLEFYRKWYDRKDEFVQSYEKEDIFWTDPFYPSGGIIRSKEEQQIDYYEREIKRIKKNIEPQKQPPIYGWSNEEAKEYLENTCTQVGPQKQPHSVNQVEAQSKSIKKEYINAVNVNIPNSPEITITIEPELRRKIMESYNIPTHFSQYEQELQKINEGKRKIDE